MTRRILITGCSRGLGRAMAYEFSQLDFLVYAVSRDELLLNEVASFSPQIFPILADINTRQGRESIYQKIDGHSLSVIHNAAIAIPASFLLADELLLREHMETNFFSPILMTKQLIPFLSGQRVLHITSGAATTALPGLMPYCASKAAMQLAMQCLGLELRQEGIFLSNLRPGMVDTPMQNQLRNSTEQVLPNRQFYDDAFKNGQLISPEVVAKFVAWVLLKTEDNEFCDNMWSIYDSSHHAHWLNALGISILYREK